MTGEFGSPVWTQLSRFSASQVYSYVPSSVRFPSAYVNDYIVTAHRSSIALRVS